MKIITGLLTLALSASISLVEVAGQCEPDTLNCVDIDEPGQICPSNLPEATLNEDYDEAITVIPPSGFELNGSQITIAYIVVDSVQNLPPGIQYWQGTERFYPDSAYCIQIQGIPSQGGEFQLSIYVSAFISFLGDTIKAGQVVDSTSVIMTVNWPAGIDPFGADEFQVLPVFPNPFLEVAKLGFYTPTGDEVNLKVFNILGEMLHEESMGVSPGEHFFRFDGNTLQPGTYFYRITDSSQYYTGKFIKSR